MLEQEADIESSLNVLLSTALGERVMVPQYGCNMDELVFESLDTRMKTLMADKIESAILYHESRIELESVQLDQEILSTLAHVWLLPHDLARPEKLDDSIEKFLVVEVLSFVLLIITLEFVSESFRCYHQEP